MRKLSKLKLFSAEIIKKSQSLHTLPSLATFASLPCGPLHLPFSSQCGQRRRGQRTERVLFFNIKKRAKMCRYQTPPPGGTSETLCRRVPGPRRRRWRSGYKPAPQSLSRAAAARGLSQGGGWVPLTCGFVAGTVAVIQLCGVMQDNGRQNKAHDEHKI